MFNFTNPTPAHPAQSAPQQLYVGKMVRWDGTAESAILLPCQSICVSPGSPAYKEFLDMPVRKMATGEVLSLGSVGIERLLDAGVSRSGNCRWDDRYPNCYPSVSDLLTDPVQFLTNAEAAEYVRHQSGMVAFIPAAFDYTDRNRETPSAPTQLEVKHISFKYTNTEYQEWLRNLTRKYTPRSYTSLFESAGYCDHTVRLNNDFSIWNVDVPCARTGVSTVSINDAVYGDNGMVIPSDGCYPRLRGLIPCKSLPGILLTDWENGSFTGTDQD